MSYDLYFSARAGKNLDHKSFAAYFASRPNYQIAKGQALYQNEDTGVYFIFDEPEDGVVAFNLNYFRPHVFGLEAAPELEQFANAFDVTVMDPQNEGMGDDATFTREGFLHGWNAGNRFGYRAMLKEQTEPVDTWPAKQIRAVWEWNHTRSAEQQRLGENIFVPAIFAINVNGQPQSVAIWPPDCAVLLPAVDALLVPLAQTGEASEELALVRWNEISPLVNAYQEKSPGLPRYRVAFPSWPAEIAAFLNKKRAAVGQLKGIALDEILDAELVAEAMKR